MKWWMAYAVLVLLSCLPGGSGSVAVDDPSPDDTGIAIQPRMVRDTVPRGCRLDSLGQRECPDLYPGKAP